MIRTMASLSVCGILFLYAIVSAKEIRQSFEGSSMIGAVGRNTGEEKCGETELVVPRGLLAFNDRR